jgi:hypothetical protein
MSNILTFEAGAAGKDDVFGPQEDNTNLRFAADGVEHSCGWTKYVPSAVRSLSAITLQLFLIDEGVGVGNVQWDFQAFGVSSSGVVIAVYTASLVVAVPNVANTLFFPTLDISTWITSQTELFSWRLARDSSNAADTYANTISFAGARTL